MDNQEKEYLAMEHELVQQMHKATIINNIKLLGFLALSLIIFKVSLDVLVGVAEGLRAMYTTLP